ncbi:hypothetical protein BRD15_10320 [Halobacteriales archaeon SW_6_65_15]|nr:MAG: hypothetical protein BRD15_10320 [Halobacteriales archaeon SW_6_65_15]
MNWKLTISRGWAKERIPTLITSFGVLFAVLYVVELFVYYSGFDVLSDDFLIGLFFSGIFFLALVYGGRWLARSDLSPDRYPRVVK